LLDRARFAKAPPGGSRTGAAAKCYRWGYRPWANAALPDFYAACTRLARADYCGSGKSYTRDGTTVDPWDRLPYASLSPLQVHDFYTDLPFEAGWNKDGAFCLSHQRWLDFDPEGECKLKLIKDQTLCDDEGQAAQWSSNEARSRDMERTSSLERAH